MQVKRKYSIVLADISPLAIPDASWISGAPSTDTPNNTNVIARVWNKSVTPLIIINTLFQYSNTQKFKIVH